MNGLPTATKIPEHVPADLVLPYDSALGPEVMSDPSGALDGVRDQRAVFYSTFYGGFWVFTQYEDIRAAFQDHELFTQDNGIPRLPYNRRFIPLSLNPPEHKPYRLLMTPLFSSRQIAKLENIIREVAKESLRNIGPRGEAEFASEFALKLPAAMFCGQLGLPTENFERFHRWSKDLIYTPQTVLKEQGEEAAKAFRKAVNDEMESFVGELLAIRRRELGDDVISTLLQAEVNGGPVTDDEVLNMVTLLFFAGTDSTAASISFAHAFLAQHPEHKQQIINHLDDPDYIWNASEELIRYNGFHHMSRGVTRDADFAGVQLKKGDTILLPTGSANRDARKFPDPLTVDFERENARQHLTFGAGVHRCVGSHLATAQLRIALEEVHAAIPDYTLSGPVEFISGGPKVTPFRVPMRFTPTP